jgi:hemoglobin-like flavoprotein
MHVVASLDPRDTEQVSLSWTLIKENNRNYIDSMSRVLDEKIDEFCPKVMRVKCQNVSAHSRAVIMQLDMLIHYLHSYNTADIDIQLDKLGFDHSTHQIQSKHYFLFGEALLATVEHFLGTGNGQRYWLRVRQSWNSFFHYLVETIKTKSKDAMRKQKSMQKNNSQRSSKHFEYEYQQSKQQQHPYQAQQYEYEHRQRFICF